MKRRKLKKAFRKMETGGPLTTREEAATLRAMVRGFRAIDRAAVVVLKNTEKVIASIDRLLLVKDQMRRMPDVRRARA